MSPPRNRWSARPGWRRPLSRRISLERRLRIYRQGAPVGEYLTEVVALLVKNDDETRDLDHFPRKWVGVVLQNTHRQALSAGLIFVVIRFPRLSEVACRWTIW